jgi:hypothetical protein
MIAGNKTGGNAMAALTQSYVNGVGEIPLIGETIGRFFEAICDKYPDRPALIVRQIAPRGR